jgi:hypothetical protein
MTLKQAEYTVYENVGPQWTCRLGDLIDADPSDAESPRRMLPHIQSLQTPAKRLAPQSRDLQGFRPASVSHFPMRQGFFDRKCSISRCARVLTRKCVPFPDALGLTHTVVPAS